MLLSSIIRSIVCRIQTEITSFSTTNRTRPSVDLDTDTVAVSTTLGCHAIKSCVALLIDLLRLQISNDSFIVARQEVYRECLMIGFKDVFLPLHELDVADAVELLHLQLVLMTAMMKDNKQMKDELFDSIVQYYRESVVGEDSFLVLNFSSVVLFTEAKPSTLTVAIIFDMMFDGNAFFAKIVDEHEYDLEALPKILSEQFYRPRIHNPKVIPIIMKLSTHCEGAVQRFIMALFAVLIDNNAPIINLASCLQPESNLLDLLLDLFPSFDTDLQTLACGLLKVLGKHSITVSQLKKIFRMLQSRGKCRPPYTALLLSSLKAMVVCASQSLQAAAELNLSFWNLRWTSESRGSSSFSMESTAAWLCHRSRSGLRRSSSRSPPGLRSRRTVALSSPAAQLVILRLSLGVARPMLPVC
jgi:hypothetical protein